MTTDELINLVAARDEAQKAVNQLRAELEKQRIKGGFYRGTDGRCVRVTDTIDRPSEFTLIHVRDELVARND